MPGELDHLKKADHNNKFSEYLALHCPEYPDWAVVAIFYAALHFVDAFLATKEIHPGDHGMRDMEVSKHLRAQYKTYRALKNDSIEARYDTTAFGDPDIKTNKDRLAEIRRGTKTA